MESQMMESEFECPEIEYEPFKMPKKMSGELDVFLDHCASLYNLILDTLHNLTPKTISCEFLEEMTSKLELSAKQIVEQQPECENLVLLRLNTICSAMEQLRVVQTHQNNITNFCGGGSGTGSTKNSCTESDVESLPASLASSPIDEMRSWLHRIEKKLAENEARLRMETNLHKILVDQQNLQLEIQRDGQFIVNHLNRELRDRNAILGFADEKKKNTIDALTRKWHTIFLNSLSLVCRIEELINYKTASDDCDSDPDLAAPPIKRSRVKSAPATPSESQDEDEDTLPFAEDEYESINMLEGSNSSSSAAISPSSSAPIQRKWDSVQQDIGYSSGENSIHETMMIPKTPVAVVTGKCKNLTPENSEMRRKRIECSPVKAFYRTVQLEDMSDLEVSKAINHDVEDEPNLSDSMYVNHDLSFNNTQNISNLSEFDEVMALYDDSMLPTDLAQMSESFNTKWREIHHRDYHKSRRSLTTTTTIEKSSCDASSEDSSEGSVQDDEHDDHQDLMNMSFNSVFENSSTSPLKRQRSGRGLKSSTFLLNTIDMNGSIYSTKSESPCVAATSEKRMSLTRRKLRVRRMPRSMSDGEQLGIFSSNSDGLVKIQISPPRSTTQLLRQLDDDLQHSQQQQDEGSSSDNQQSDSGQQQAYEWDEYNPPEKDDSNCVDPADVTNNTSMEFSQIDEDFSEHFGNCSMMRLVEESKSNLRIVKAALEDEKNLEEQLANFELIARINLKQLRMQKQSRDPQIYELAEEWEKIHETVSNPFLRIMQQVKKFASTLQEVDTIAAFNDFQNIENREDVTKALENCRIIERRLSLEREQLGNLIESQVFKKVGRQISAEFGMVTEGYDEAIRRIGGMSESLAAVKRDWDEMHGKNEMIRNTIVQIESQLKDGKLDTKMISDEMELCQERMDNLETMCNFLTDSLVSLKQDNRSENLPDFKKDLSIYSIALKTLKDRLGEIDRIPTPPLMPETISTQTSDEISDQTSTENMEVSQVVQETIGSSRTIKILFALSFIFALAAICYYHIFSKHFGPHLEYVKGPPPF